MTKAQLFGKIWNVVTDDGGRVFLALARDKYPRLLYEIKKDPNVPTEWRVYHTDGGEKPVATLLQRNPQILLELIRPKWDSDWFEYSALRSHYENQRGNMKGRHVCWKDGPDSGKSVKKGVSKLRPAYISR